MATSRVTFYFPSPVALVRHTVTGLTHTVWQSDLPRYESHFVEHTKSVCAAIFTITACKPPLFRVFIMERGRIPDFTKTRHVPDAHAGFLTELLTSRSSLFVE